MQTYTVLGLWIDERPVVAGVVKGEHPAVDTEWESDGFQRWGTTVVADSANAAEVAACEEMLG